MKERGRCAQPYLYNGVSSGRRLHGPPAAFRLIVSSVVGLGLHLNPQLVRARVGRQLPVEGGQRRAAKEQRRSVTPGEPVSARTPARAASPSWQQRVLLAQSPDTKGARAWQLGPRAEAEPQCSGDLCPARPGGWRAAPGHSPARTPSPQPAPGPPSLSGTPALGAMAAQGTSWGPPCHR